MEKKKAVKEVKAVRAKKAKAVKEAKTEAKAEAKAEVKAETKPEVKAEVKAEGFPISIKGTGVSTTVKVKAKGKTETREYKIGAKITLPIEDIDMPEVMKEVFTHVLSEGYPKDKLELSLKGGYRVNQFGLTRPTERSWRGYLTYTDSKFCCHENRPGGVMIDQIKELGKKHNLTVNTKGKNWVTWVASKASVENCKAFAREFVDLLK